jgi:hypothetical protein
MDLSTMEIGLFLVGLCFVIGFEKKSKKERQKRSRGTKRQSKGETIKADACSTASVDLYKIIQRVMSRGALQTTWEVEGGKCIKYMICKKVREHAGKAMGVKRKMRARTISIAWI